MPTPAGYGMPSPTLRSGYSAARTLAVAMPMAATKTAETAAARFIMTTSLNFLVQAIKTGKGAERNGAMRHSAVRKPRRVSGRPRDGLRELWHFRAAFRRGCDPHRARIGFDDGP